MKRKKRALLNSVVSLILCFSMLLTTTFAWFTDSVTTGINTIAAGTLDVELYHSNAAVTDERVDSTTKLFMDLQGNPILWEPGAVSYENLRIANEGDLALIYQLAINTANENYVIDPSGAQYGLSQILKVGLVEGGVTATDRAGVVASVNDGNWTTLANFFRSDSLLPKGESTDEKTWGIVVYWEQGENDNYWNLNNGKQINTGDTLSIDLGIQLVATQGQYESDSFDSNYDNTAKTDTFPVFNATGSVTSTVKPNDQNKTSEKVVLTTGQISASVPAGVQLNAGTTALTMSVTEKNESEANLSLGENEAIRSLDVHIEGVGTGNTVPMIIDLGEIMPIGLNEGNVKLYHVENGSSNNMARVNTMDELDAHNEFYYDPVTGRIAVAMATFSEVAMVADTTAAWQGNVDHSWYDANKNTLTIANADQLWSFSQIVGGMAKDKDENSIVQDDFAGKTVSLISDINLNDDEKNNSKKIFYPIGYYNSTGSYEKTSGGSVTSSVSSFEGTFNGNGHTISNFYQNTWEMFGDYNDGYSGTPNHYKDAMGLFGYVFNGTVKNLTVNNFSSDGEFAPTGVIAAYADGNTKFENIAITNCNPRVYNTGNGGIIGIAGDTSAANDDHITLKNITVDNSNKISALWGSWDVACGGLVGMYRGNVDGSGNATGDTISFENCHVAAQIDVYNDVCANYQYYAYRYAGMMIGSIRHNTTSDDKKTIPNMVGITATDCTVHFGTWNDYYYCELVDNTTASYTHDYQMSRLVEIKGINGTNITYLDDTTGTVPTSGRANYVIVDYNKGHGTENATCYHFKDGEVWTHDMGGIQTGIDENGDGQDDLKEDKQHVYLEFNNLFTGYGWGVSSMALDKWNGIEKLDVELGAQDESIEKFMVNDNVPEITSGLTVKVGDLFKGKENLEYNIDTDNVHVFVSPIGDDSTVAVEYIANTADWTQGTLKFSGSGSAEVIITDYNYCKETKLPISINTVDKFKALFDSNPEDSVVQTPFLYRVGNANDVKLSSLFTSWNEEVSINSANVTVNVESIDNSNASGIFTQNTSDWKNGTIDFNGTGPVKVTIAGDSANAVVLTLEVIDAWNATTALSAPHTYNEVEHNVVLLNDVDNGSFTVSGDYGFYGNGFTIKLNPDSHSTVKGNGYAGYIHMNGGTLDNVQIEGPVYSESNIYQSQGMPSGTTNPDTKVDYFRNAINIDGGNAKIINSYISGARTAVCVKAGGDVVIENSRITGGAYANIEVLAAKSLSLKSVTTEQTETEDSYSQKKNVVGTGIVINSAETKLILDDVIQYNWITEEQWNSMLGSYSNSFPKLFSNSYQDLQYSYNGTSHVNTGIIWACEITTSSPNIVGAIEGYKIHKVSLGSVNGAVYTKTKSSGDSGNLNDSDKKAPFYKVNNQGAVPPIAVFDYTSKNNEPEQNGSNDYCYYNADSKKFMISFEEGSSKVWDSNILSVTKGTTNLSYTVSVSNGATVNDDDTITFNKAGDYTVTYTYTDSYNYTNTNGEVNNYEETYHKYINVTVFVVEPKSDPTIFVFGVDRYKTVSAGGLTYVMPDVTKTKDPTISNNVVTASGIGSKTIDGETIYYPIVGMHKVGSSFGYYNYFSIFEAVIIKDANGRDVYSISTSTVPANLQVIGGFIGNGAESANGTKIFDYSTGKAIKTNSVKVKGENVGLCYYPDSSFSSTTTARPEQTIVVKYCYTDTNGKSYYYYIGYWCAQGTKGIESSSGCLAEGTMISLADGTQKPIEQITYEDELLAWDFHTGNYATTVPSLIESHTKDEYRVINLEFSDGNVVRVVVDHGFFDVEANNFVFIDENNVDSYIGHEFVKINKDGNYETAKLLGYDITVEEIAYYSIQTAIYNNSIAENMFTLPAPPEMLENDGWFDYFEIGDNMKYDEAKMQADIEKYGLYDYSEFADYITYEQFIAFNGPYLKVLVGRGIVTFEQILELIDIYVNN